MVRTDYTLQDIFDNVKIEPGTVYTYIPETKQLGLFDEPVEPPILPMFKYLPVNITEVYKQEMEEIES